MTTLTATEAKLHSVNDVVTFAPELGWPKKNMGMRLVMTKVPSRRNEVNYIADPCDAEGVAIPGARGFKGPAYAFLPATDDNTPSASITSVPFARPVNVNPVKSSIVKPNPESRIPDGYYVVTGEIDHERVRVEKIGGDAGRYWKVYSKRLTVIDPADVFAALDLI